MQLHQRGVDVAENPDCDIGVPSYKSELISLGYKLHEVKHVAEAFRMLYYHTQFNTSIYYFVFIDFLIIIYNHHTNSMTMLV